MLEHHPKQPIWFIIRPSSSDCDRIHGNQIAYESFAHYVYYAMAKVRISSSLWGGDLPKMSYFKQMRRIMGRKKVFVFLKHGIVKDFLPQHCYGEGYPDMYVCGAKSEYDYVKKKFGYPGGVVKYLGLARFDNLHGHSTKRQILFMPTFRKWLQVLPEDEIAQSEYVKRWNEAIQKLKLLELLKKNDLQLVFYPHYMMQKYIDLFCSQSERVKIAAFKDYDVQTLLIESCLLVTDFSSVFFDFSYMEKPVIYYQFDRDRYIKEHYDFTKGYFSYDDDGFGEVVSDCENLIASIERAVERSFKPESIYQERRKAFFPLHDQNNCNRIFHEIIRMVSQKKRGCFIRAGKGKTER